LWLAQLRCTFAEELESVTANQIGVDKLDLFDSQNGIDGRFALAIWMRIVTPEHLFNPLSSDATSSFRKQREGDKVALSEQ
jgi:hypothetical protein